LDDLQLVWHSNTILATFLKDCISSGDRLDDHLYCAAPLTDDPGLAPC
jgi:hypothetical protein